MTNNKANSIIDKLDKDLFDSLLFFLRKCGYLLDQSHIDRAGKGKVFFITQLFYGRRIQRLEPKKRSVLRSSLLKSKISDPGKYGISATDIQAIDEIEKISTEGGNLFPYSNKDTGRLPTSFEKQDKLFNDWNIHHFHLGTSKEKNSAYMERTKNVMLVYPTDDENNLLFLDVRSHDRNDPEPWYDKSYIEIIHAEWPHLIKEYIPKGITSISPKIDEQTVQILRGDSKSQKSAAKKAGDSYTTAFVHFVTMDDGTIYCPLSLGMVSNGERSTVRDTGPKAIKSNFDFSQRF